ncbi:hypothetical protein [Micromonospora sp. NPDC093277]|uniref:hypothetical protein n=1 Tax=Micromonospora sp. NPDC093277 TaxID=3364291 RepID=UPI00381CD883
MAVVRDVQAKRSAVAANLPASRWLAERARRGGDQRQRAHDALIETWRWQEEHLVRLRIEAAGFLGCTEPRTGLPTELDHDEVVYRVLPTVELIEAEARHLTGLPAPGLTVAAATVDEPERALPAGLRVVDAGMAVVTDRRIVFAGRDGRREWTYRSMLGPGHHPDVPITLLHTADGRRPAGLRIPAAAAVNTRFYLTLAFATATGARAAVVGQVDALLAAHRDARPAPPAAPHAPFPVPHPERMSAAGAAVVAVTLAALVTGTLRAEPAEPPYGTGAGAGGAAVTPEAGGITGDPVPSPLSDPAPTVRPPATAPGGRTAGDAATGGRPVAEPVTRRSTVPAARATTSAPAPTARPTPTAAPATRTPGPAPATAPAPTAVPSPTASAGSAVRADCPGLLRLPLVESLLCR